MLTRRRFLQLTGVVIASAAAGSGACTTRRREADQHDPNKPRPFTVSLLSDTHVHAFDAGPEYRANSKLTQALADLRPLRPDLWIVNGDVTDNGYPAQYVAFKQIMTPYHSEGQLLVTTGNHEFYDKEAPDDIAIQRFRDAFNQPQPYGNHVFAGVHFVLLATEQWKTAPRKPDWAWLTPRQLEWFEQALNEHRNQFTAVFLHQPLQETVASSYGANPFGGSGQVEELRAILAKNPQVKLWFSGHTHRRQEMENQNVHQGHTTFLALGSTYYQGRPKEGAGFTPDGKASQSRVMEIWPDKVVVRARDHGEGIWLDDLSVTLPLT